jgi:hypothetical protein
MNWLKRKFQELVRAYRRQTTTARPLTEEDIAKLRAGLRRE